MGFFVFPSASRISTLFLKWPYMINTLVFASQEPKFKKVGRYPGQAQGLTPGIPALWEAKEDGSFEVRSWRPA